MKKWVLTPYSYLVDKIIQPWKDGQPLLISEWNGWGSRWTGKTVQIINLVFLLNLLRPDKKITFYGVRKMIENKREFFDTIMEHIPPELSYETNISNKTIKREGLHIEIIGLAENSKKIAQKLGKTRLKSDLTIICFDEAFEFSETDFMNVIMGVGLGAESIISYCSNPYSPTTPFFKKVLAKQPYNEKTAREDFHEVLFENDKVFHFMTPYALWDEGILSDAIKTSIDQAEITDPLTGAVVRWGKPLMLSGGIYSRELRFIHVVNSVPPAFYDGNILMGIDFGYSQDETAVSASVISADETSLCVIGEKVIGTKLAPFDTAKQANEIFKFIAQMWKKYQWGGVLTIRCENDFAFVEQLNSLLTNNKTTLVRNHKTYYLRDVIEFERVSEKYQKDRIAKRIKTMLRLMASGKMYALKKDIPTLWNEWEMMKWKKNPQGITKIQREDGNDHALNSLEYAISPYLSTLGLI